MSAPGGAEVALGVRLTHVFLDRDGTLIRHVPYLRDPRDVELLPTVAAGLDELRKSGRRLFLHTNQSGIGRGYFSLADAVACNEAMLRQIGLGSGLFEDICICPEMPDQESRYRKPSAAWGLEIIARDAIERGAACYVGDNVTDLETARNIGCAGVGVNTGAHDLRQMLRASDLEQFPVFDRFVDAASYIVDQRRLSNGTN